MEDLREEPELEEREEKDEEDEEEVEEVEEEETDDKSTCSDPEAEILMKPPTPVRSPFEKGGIQNFNNNWPNSILKKPLLETNFSVTGINEIKTQQIPMGTERQTNNNNLPQRPMSLYLQNSANDFKSRPESIHIEKVTTKLLDISNPQ